jgi:uncharacterized repeat protein (TIGR01451 family)
VPFSAGVEGGSTLGTRVFRLICAVVAGVLLVVTGATLTGGAANAVVNPTGSRIYDDQTFYAYVGTGETLDASLQRTSAASGPVTITVTDPAGTIATSCAHPVGTPNGTTCALNDLSSTTAGVWAITLDADSAARYTFNIVVRDATDAAVTGRVWTTKMNQYQTSASPQSYWIATREGYLYGVQFVNYNGVGSSIQANGFGLVDADTCTPIYRSAEGTAIGANGVFLDPSVEYSETCGDDYLLFLETPAVDLPASAPSASGPMWIRPTVVAPSATNLAFTADSSTSRAGQISFDLAGVNGGYSVQVDTNADGDYTDAVDRIIPWGSPPGSIAVPFNGLDGLGVPIGVCQPINARVVVDRVGETHFVLQDVEQLGNAAGTAAGVRVTGLTSVNAPNPKLYWNDTALAPTRSGFVDKAPFGGVDGTAGVDTATLPAGGGTHGWRNDWGDVRSVENWTYYRANAGAEAVIPAPCLPGMTIDKHGELDDANDNGSGDVGEQIAYSFLVSNTGNAPLTGVAVIDPKVSGLTPATADISVGGTQLFSAAPYTITQADVDAGGITNTATASGESPGGGEVETPPDTVIITGPDRDPKLSIDKRSVLNEEVAVDGVAELGETVSYSFTVTNTGNVTLSDVKVGDSRVTGITPASVSLAPGASQVFTAVPYTVTQSDINTGSIVNTATASGVSPVGYVESPPDTDTVLTPTPQAKLELDKTGALLVDVDDDAVIDAGDTVRYSFSVSNTGNVDLIDVSIDDPRVAGAIAPSAANIAAGGSRVYLADYVVTQADIDAGVLRNTATASGSYVPPDGSDVDVHSAPDTVELPTDAREPALSLQKSGSLSDTNGNGFADVGESITYSFAVTNTGNTTLAYIEVLDARVTGLVPSTNPLAQGGTVTIAADPYVVTQADVDAGGVHNVASARAHVPGGPEAASSPDELDIETPRPAPALQLEKLASLDDLDNDGAADAGERITYSFRLLNSGNTTLKNVAVRDAMLGELVPDPIEQLAPGVSVTLSARPYTVTAADARSGPIVNVASAVGTSPGGDATESATDTVATPTPTTPAVPVAPGKPDAAPGHAPQAEPDITLADTGSRAFGAGGAAVLTLMLGAALIAARRRRA